MSRDLRSFPRDGDACAVEVAEELLDLVEADGQPRVDVPDPRLGLHVVLDFCRVVNL